MDEIRRDYYDQLQEQNLTRRVGHVSKRRLPTENELKKQCQPVRIVTYPEIATLAERIKYLQGNSATVDFCRRAEMGLKAYYRIQGGDIGTADPHFLKRIAHNLGCPLEWLATGTHTDTRIEQEESQEEPPAEKQPDLTQELPEPQKALPVLGSIAARLRWLRSSMRVEDFCKKMGISCSTYYRYCKPNAPVAKAVLEIVAQNAGIPAEWLLQGKTGESTQMEKEPKDNQAEQNTAMAQGICLKINGRFTPEQLVAILTGLQGRLFDVQLALQETKNAV